MRRGFSRAGLIVLGTVMWSLTPVTLTDAQQAVPGSVDEARQIAERIAKSIDRPSRVAPAIRARSPLPLLSFLDSKSQAVRAIASQAFRQMVFRTPIVLDPCLPYLGPARPAEERVPLLALCASQVRGVYTDTHSSKMSVGKVRGFLKDALNSELCPPLFHVLAAALARRHAIYQTSNEHFGFPITDIAAPGKEAVIARRLLAVIIEVDKIYHAQPSLRFEDGRRDLVEMVVALGEEQAGEVVENWYRAEPDPRARSVVVNKRLSWSEDPQWRARRKGILQLAAKDWREEIATKAKALLAQ